MQIDEIKQLIGDLVLQLHQLKLENDRLSAQLADKEAANLKSDADTRIKAAEAKMRAAE